PRRPQLLTLYFDEVDHDGHGHGPHSPEARAAQRRVDDALATLLQGLQARGLRDTVDIIVVSDHGMAEVPPGQREYLDDWLAAAGLSIADVEVVSTGAVAGLSARAGNEVAVADALVRRHAHAQCWRKQALPERWHYGTHPRVPAIVCQADDGWIITRRPPPDSDWRPPTHLTGAHGYDTASPE